MKADNIIIALLALILLIGTFSAWRPKDTTDPPDGRSGMGLHTDHETGCQYLSHPRGGLTPRLDSTGKHICKAD